MSISPVISVILVPTQSTLAVASEETINEPALVIGGLKDPLKLIVAASIVIVLSSLHKTLVG